MRIKYFFIFVIIIGQITVATYTWREAKQVRIVQAIFDESGQTSFFTEKGESQVLASFNCLNDDAKKYFSLQDDRISDDAAYIRVIRNVFQPYPTHILQTRKHKDCIEIDILFNLTKPIVITVTMLREYNQYKIDNIKNLCELFGYVNLYFEKRKELNGEI